MADTDKRKQLILCEQERQLIHMIRELGAFSSGDVPSTIIGSDSQPVDEGGTVTMTPEVTVTNGKASAAVGESDMTSTIAAAKKCNASSVTVSVETDKNVNAANVTLNSAAVKSLANDTDMALNVETPVGAVSIPHKTLSSMIAQTGSNDVKLLVENKAASDVKLDGVDVTTATIVAITITAGTKSITNFNGEHLTVSIPISGSHKAGDSYKVIVVSADGTVETLVGKVVVKDGKTCVEVSVSHLSTFVVTTQKVASFTDVASTAWYYDAVQYAALHGLMAGTGSDKFSPDSAMTRAMLVTVLYCLDGSPAVTGTNSFADVKDGQWYNQAVIWANQKGIVAGYGSGLFGTNDKVTRQQMATILYGYAQYKGYDATKTTELTAYTDTNKLTDWAQPAMKWAKGEGLIGGTSATTLSPTGNATRAQVATILMRFSENTVK